MRGSFLADASAIQFTRNPNGIGSALKKIGGYSLGSLMMEAEAKEVSHMLFGEGVRKGFTGFLATHPPLDERIKRIEPRWRAISYGGGILSCFFALMRTSAVTHSRGPFLPDRRRYKVVWRLCLCLE